jgi:fucose permease
MMKHNRIQTFSSAIILLLTYLMFLVFALTVDSVGGIIPQLIETFQLSQTVASAFHYVTMGGFGLSGFILGFVADRFTRKFMVILSLALFSGNSLLFAVSQGFELFLVLLFLSGIAIGLFKTAAMAIISDLSACAKEHTRAMNMIEAFFAIGSMLGSALVTLLMQHGYSWTWLYVVSGSLCLVLLFITLPLDYPAPHKDENPLSLRQTLSLLKDPYVLYFSLLIMLYVGVEVAVFVWMPTLLHEYQRSGGMLAAYATSIFFTLRTLGRFLGGPLLTVMPWTLLLLVCSAGVCACFLGALVMAFRPVANGLAYWLPASGFFMSVMYPTLNSKGISCFQRSQHAAMGGVLLFFSCVSAACVPLAMGAVSDAYGGDARFGFMFAGALSVLLLVMLLHNHLRNPAAQRLRD